MKSMESELCRAIQKGNTKVALALIAAGADPNIGTVVGTDLDVGFSESNLYIAIKKSNTRVVLALIAAGADLDNGLVMSDGETHSNLYKAILKGNTEIALALIKEGADLDSGMVWSNGYRTSNLYEAINRGNTEIALALIKKGADLDSGKVWSNGYRTSNLCVAIQVGNTEVALELIERGAQLSVLIYNECIKKPEIAKALFRRLLYLGDGFPSLSALSVLSLPRMPSHDTTPLRVVDKCRAIPKDIAFLSDYGPELTLPSEQESLISVVGFLKTKHF